MPNRVEGPAAGDEDEPGVAISAEEPAGLRELCLRHEACTDDPIPGCEASPGQLHDLIGAERGKSGQHADATARRVHVAGDHHAAGGLPGHRAARPPADDTRVAWYD